MKIIRSRTSRTAAPPRPVRRARAAGRPGRAVVAVLAAQPVDGLVAGGGDDPSCRARGQPVDGQQATAAANASWTASSARSMSPKSPTRTATAQPHCSRKTHPRPPRRSAGTPGLSPGSWNGRTSTGRVVTRASLPPHASAASGSRALTMVNPPTCSLPSAKGPSVTSVSRRRPAPPWPCWAGAAPGEHPPRPPISSFRASRSRSIRSSSSAGGAGRRAGSLGRYCFARPTPSWRAPAGRWR